MLLKTWSMYQTSYSIHEIKELLNMSLCANKMQNNRIYATSLHVIIIGKYASHCVMHPSKVHMPHIGCMWNTFAVNNTKTPLKIEC